MLGYLSGYLILGPPRVIIMSNATPEPEASMAKFVSTKNIVETLHVLKSHSKGPCIELGTKKASHCLQGLDGVTLSSRVYLNPEEPTFLGFLIMISLYRSLKR